MKIIAIYMLGLLVFANSNASNLYTSFGKGSTYSFRQNECTFLQNVTKSDYLLLFRDGSYINLYSKYYYAEFESGIWEAKNELFLTADHYLMQYRYKSASLYFFPGKDSANLVYAISRLTEIRRNASTSIKLTTLEKRFPTVYAVDGGNPYSPSFRKFRFQINSDYIREMSTPYPVLYRINYNRRKKGGSEISKQQLGGLIMELDKYKKSEKNIFKYTVVISKRNNLLLESRKAQRWSDLYYTSRKKWGTQYKIITPFSFKENLSVVHKLVDMRKFHMTELGELKAKIKSCKN